MRETDASLQQSVESLLKARLVKETAAPYCVRWVRPSWHDRLPMSPWPTGTQILRGTRARRCLRHNARVNSAMRAADLDNNLVWRYSSPERGAFKSVEQHRRGESLSPRLLPPCVIAVDALLVE